MSDRYREDLDRAVGFAGVTHEYFARAKAIELLALAERHLGPPADLQALEAGCGIGLVLRALEGRFGSLTGADIDREALDVARRENPGVRLEASEPGRLPFDDDEFDLSFAATVVQVIPVEERPVFVGELRRVTKPGGLTVIFEHNPLNPVTRHVVRRFDSPDAIGLMPRSETRRLLLDAGLQPVESGYYLALPTRRRRILDIERAARRLPLGAQYWVAARKAAV